MDCPGSCGTGRADNRLGEGRRREPRQVVVVVPFGGQRNAVAVGDKRQDGIALWAIEMIDGSVALSLVH